MTSNGRTVLQREIAATDRQIGSLVYELYGLTPDEIQIVEQDRNEPASLPDADEIKIVEEGTGS